jgi:hypothetical protein
MNAPRRVHLLSADDALAEGYRFGGYLTLCGEPIDTSDLPSARCPDECDCEPRCLDVAMQRNWEAGVALGCPPGITVVTAHAGWISDQPDRPDGQEPSAEVHPARRASSDAHRAGTRRLGGCCGGYAPVG